MGSAGSRGAEKASAPAGEGSGRFTQVVGGAAAAVLVLVGALHLVWTVSTWPLADREDFARLVVGVPVEELPSAGLTAGVAVLVLFAAALVATEAGLLPAVGPAWVRRTGVLVVAGVLLLRGVGGLVVELARPDSANPDFARWDLMLYAPLCVGLGLAAAWVGWRALGSRRE